VCQKCKKEDRNTKPRIDNYKPEHGHASNSTTLESLLMSPNHMHLKARFEDRKRQDNLKTSEESLQIIPMFFQRMCFSFSDLHFGKDFELMGSDKICTALQPFIQTHHLSFCQPSIFTSY
jgi:hypothetical protein